ncbi:MULTISPECIES: Ig-like domain-containing protein [Bartonella]|uniref:Ig-like domain-containing protein n=1 Tax=Bartonella TaxID=773 RepID=UPI0018DB11C8|nr:MULTISPECIES: Ig-like domain-containing protein [Bartonella]MBH9993783.1 BapA prefix-like domain-containing protein [Bartonella sp. P0291]MBH9997871.1 BapA prefix-like domain-containing protein [Bartonella sp. M0192]MBI0000030.1 BapA prefix-like domain-containing protein [Bartonella sp. M0191]MBI0007593.1 BapA prefix-like domain-containing protein [Bartonella sp. M0193]MBI0011321.1 BapA prefix-like domain-containing protein [Bartonella sp. M0176]
MTKSDIIKQHPVVKLTEKSGAVDSGGKPLNFVLTADKESISNYSRAGNDLIINFADGKTVRIKNFFNAGHPICNLIFIDDGATWLTDFSQALSANGDGVVDSNVLYEEITDKSGYSNAVLLGILGAVGAGSGIAAQNSNDDNNHVEEGNKTTPAAPTYFVVNNNDPKNLLAVRNGGYLNDTTPLLSGKGTPGNTIRIHIDGFPDMTTKVNSDGTWSFELPKLDDGKYIAKVTQIDANGNVSTEANYEFNVDTHAPDAPSVSRGIDDVSPNPVGSDGTLKDGDYTNDNTPALAGKGEPGSTVKIYDTDDKGNKTLVGQGTVDKDGNWSVETNKALSEGHHKLTTTLTDPAGNESAGTDFNINIDSSKPGRIEDFRVEDNYPEITGALPLMGGTTDDETPVFSGKIGKDVTHIIIKLNGHEFVIDRNTLNEAGVQRGAGEKVIRDDGTFAFRLPEAYKLTKGNYNYEVYAKNKVGNESDHINGNFAFDRTLPPAIGNENLDVIDNVGSVTGSYKDWAQRDSDHKKVTDDNHAVFKGKIPSGYDVTKVDHINIYDNGKKIGEAKVNSDGSFEYKQEWLQGEHRLSAAIVNKYGTVGEQSKPDDYDFWVDLNRAGPPSIQQVQDDQGHYHESGYPTNSNSFFVTGGGPSSGKVTLRLYDKDGNPVKNYKGEPLEWTADVSKDGSWSVNTGDLSHLNPPLKDGNYSFKASAVDSKGASTDASGSHWLERDTTAPDAPDAPKAMDNVGEKRGEITSGATTDDDTPTLSGKGKKGEVVKIYDNDGKTPIGETVVGEDGTWSFTPNPPLKGGDHSLTTTLTDAAGNESEKSGAVKVTVDKSGVEIFADGAHDNEGAIRKDVHDNGVTDDRTPTLYGRGTPNGTVVITDENGKEIGKTKVDGAGNWQFELPSQAGDNQEVTHTYHAKITNAAGNTQTADFHLTIDTKAPDAPAIDKVIDNVGNKDNATNHTNGDKELHSGDTTDDTTPTFSGKGTVGDVIKLYDGDKLVGQTTVKDDGTWSVSPTSPISNTKGTHEFTTTATDPAGNESNHSGKFLLGFDTEPVPTMGNSKDEVDLIDDAGSIVGSYRDGEWATRQGQHGEKVIITDDTTPTLKGRLPTDLLNSGRISTVNIYDNGKLLTKIPVKGDGSWEYTPTLNAGNNHNFEVAYENKAGVEGAHTSFPFVLDMATVGQTSIDSATTGTNNAPYTWDNPTKENVFHLQGSGPANSIITVYLKDGSGNVIHTFETTTSNGSGSWSQTVDLSTVSVETRKAIADGRYSFVADARNDAGTVGAKSGDSWVNRDTTAPAKPDIVKAEDNSGDQHGSIEEGKTYDEDMPLLSGKGEKNSIVTIYDGDKVIGETTVHEDGTWSWTPTTPLKGGAHSITTTLTDAAGNVSDKSDPLGFNLDLTPPEVKIDHAVDDYQKDAKTIVNGGATNDATPKLVGRGTAGQKVTILDKTTGSTYETTVKEDGTWEYQLPVQQNAGEDKTHEYIASLTNNAGNKVEHHFNLHIDTKAPATPQLVEVIDNVGNDPVKYPNGNRPLNDNDITDDTTPTFNGKGVAGDIIKLYTVNELGERTLIGQTKVNDDGTWSVTPTVALTDDPKHSPTKYTFIVTETDSVGNESNPTDGYNLFIDRDPPVLDDKTIKLVDDKETNVGDFPNWIEKDDGKGGKIKLTNDDTPTMSGRAISGDTQSVNIYDNGKLIGSAEIDKNGDWSFTPSTGHGLADGVHEWIARPVDKAGNEGQPTPAYKFEVDTKGPTGTLGSDIGLWDDEGPQTGEFDGANGTTAWSLNDANHKVTDDKTPEIKGKLPAGSDVTKVHIYVDGTLSGIADVAADGTWSYTPHLSSGTHTIEARPADDAGNEGQAKTWNFDIAGAAPGMPAITGIYNNDAKEIDASHPDGKFIDKNQFTNDATPLIKGTGDAGSFINIYIGDKLVAKGVKVGGDGHWSVAIDPSLVGILPNGESWQIRASASDSAGQESDKTGFWPINVDTLKPTTPDLPKLDDHVGDKKGDVEQNSTIDDKAPTIHGKAGEGNVVVDIYDTVDGKTKHVQTVTSDSEGNWSYTPTDLGQGKHSITTTYTDKAGNISDKSPAFDFNIDSSAILVSINYAADNEGHIVKDLANGATTDDTTPTLFGTTTSNTVVTIKEGEKVIGTVTSDEHGNWSFELPEQTNGHHVYTASVTAQNGNNAHSDFALDIDNTPPASPDITRVQDDVPLNTDDLVSGGKTNDTKPTFYGEGNPGDTVTIYDEIDGKLVKIGTANIGNDHKWVCTVDELAPGAHHFKLQTTNKLGVDSEKYTEYDLTVKTDAPTETTSLVSITEDRGLSDSDFKTGDDSLVFKFGVNEKLPAGYKVQVNVDGKWYDATYDENDGYWYYDHSNIHLAEGVHKVYGRVVDDAGNAKDGPAQDVTIDKTAPIGGDYQIVIDSFTDDVNEEGGSKSRGSGEATNDNTPTLNGHTSGMKPGDYVTVQVKIGDDWVTIGTAKVDASGNWKFDVKGIPGGTATDHLNDGYHEFRGVITDEAGNLGQASSGFGLTVATTPPPLINESGLDLFDDQLPKTGTIFKGTTTDDSRPTLKGAAHSVDPTKVGSINLYDNGELVGTGKVNSDGSWSVEPTVPLRQGNHSFVAKPVDYAGNEQPQGTTAWDFNFVGHAPATPSIINVLDDNGDTIQKDAVTRDSTPLIKGTGTTGSTVYIYVDGKQVATAKVKDDGTWETTLPTLANPATDRNGTRHVIKAIALDKEGTTWSHETGGYPVIVDRQAPDAPDAPTAKDDQGNTITGTTADSTPTLSGKVNGNQPGDKVNIYQDGVKVGEAKVSDQGDWSWTPKDPLGKGGHQYQTSVSDAAGNESAKGTATNITVDTSTVKVSIDYLVDDQAPLESHITNNSKTDDRTPLIVGKATPNSDVVLTYTDANNQVHQLAKVRTDGEGNWSYQVKDSEKFGEGHYVIHAETTDASGGKSTADFNFDVDITNNQQPSIDRVTDDVGAIQNDVVNGGSTDDTTPTIIGSGAKPYQKVNIYDQEENSNGEKGESKLIGSVIADGQGKWSFTPPSPLGGDTTHHLSATTVDEVGNESGHSPDYNVIVDVAAPEPIKNDTVSVTDDVQNDKNDFVGKLAKDQYTNDNRPEYSGKAPSDAKTVNIYDNGKLIGSTKVKEDGTWSFTPDETHKLSEGQHTLTARPVDSAGNEGTDCQGSKFIVDTIAPSAIPTIDSVSNDTGPKDDDLITQDRNPTIFVRVNQPLADNEHVEISLDDGLTWFTASYNERTGKYYYAVGHELTDQVYHVRARVVDAAGNVGQNTTRDLTIDNTPPLDGYTVTIDTFHDDVENNVGDYPSGTATNDKTPLLKGTVRGAHEGDVVHLYYRDSQGNLHSVADNIHLTSNGNGTYSWQYQLPELADGNYQYVAIVKDAAGNEGASSNDFFLTVDVTGPQWGDTNSIKLIDDQQPDTGVIPHSGGVTDDNYPELQAGAGTVTGAAGGIVELYDGNTKIGEGLIEADGSFKIIPNKAITPGQHRFHLVAVDQAGNRTPLDNVEWNFNFAGHAPGTPSITNIIDDYNNPEGKSVYLQKGQSTDDATPTLHGMGTKGTRIHIYKNDQEINTDDNPVIVGEDGTWTFKLPAAYALKDTSTNGLGTHYNFAVQAVDQTGAPSSKTGNYPIVYDNHAPNQPDIPSLQSDQEPGIGTIENNGTTPDQTPTFSGTVQNPQVGDKVTIFKKVDGSYVKLGETTVDPSSGKWSWTPENPLDKGDYEFAISVTDAAGNESAKSQSTSVTIDPTSVDVSILYAVDDEKDSTGDYTGKISDGGLTNDATPELHGRATANSTVTIYTDVGGVRTEIGTVYADGNGDWTFVWPKEKLLPDGSHTIVAEATLPNNSTKSDSFTLVVDTQNNHVPEIVSVSDDVGANQSDNLASGAASDDTTPTLKGHGAEPNGMVNIYDTVNGETHLVDSVKADSNGNWEYSVQSPLPEGEHHFQATSVDAAGNESDKSSEFKYTIDLTAPDALQSVNLTDDVPETTGTISNNGMTNDDRPTYSGSATADIDKVFIYDHGVKIGEAKVVENNGQYTWSYTPDTALANGDHSFQAKPVDAVGNIGIPTGAWNFKVLTGTIATKPKIVGISQDTGFDTNDYVTSDTQPTIYIKTNYPLNAANGEKVQINIGGQWYDTEYDAANDRYFFRPVTALPASADGTNYSIKTRIIDNAGRTSDIDEKTMTLDNQGPDGTITLDKFVDNVGVEAELSSHTKKNYTDDRTPELHGTVSGAKSGDYVVIYLADKDGNILKDENGKPIKLGSVHPNGTNWTFTANLDAAHYPDNDYYFVAVLEDKAGNQGPKSSPLGLSLTTEGPDWSGSKDFDVYDDQGLETGNIANNGVTDDNRPTVKGKAGSLDPAKVASVLLYDCDPSDPNAKPIGRADIKSDGSWEVEPDSPLMPGHHRFWVVPVNHAGVVGNIKSDVVEFDLIGHAPGTPSITQIGHDDDPNVLFPDNQIQQNGITRDDTPFIKGTGTKGSYVKIYDRVNGEDRLLDTVKVDNDGHWETSLRELDDGTHNIWVQATDAGGNTSAATAPYPFVVDTTAPDKPGRPTITSDVAPDKGEISNANIDHGTTNDTTPTFSGKLDKPQPGDVVTIYDGDKAIGEAKVDPDSGSWSFTPTTPLDKGKHHFTTTVKDAAGNESDRGFGTDITIADNGNTVTVDYAFDNEDPIKGPIANGGHTDDTTPELYGTAPAGSTVNVYTDSSKQTKVGGPFNVGSDGTWSIGLTEQTAGEHNYYVEATGADGTVLGGQDFKLNIDNGEPDRPTITGVTDDVGLIQGTVANGGSRVDNGTTDDTNPTIKGTAPKNSLVIIYDDGKELGRVYADGNGNWSYTTGAMLTENDHKFTAVSQNAEGKTSGVSNEYVVTVDITAPKQITGETVQDNVLPNSANGEEGPAIITVNQNDHTNDDSPIFSGTAPSDAKKVRIYDNNKLIAEVDVDSDHTWFWEAGNRNSDAKLANGSHSLTARPVDAAGNEGPASEAHSFIVDKTVPGAKATLDSITDDTGFESSDFTTQDNTLLFSFKVDGTLKDTDKVQALINNQWYDLTYNSANGKWELDWRNKPALADGSYVIKTRVISSTGIYDDDATDKSAKTVVIDTDGSTQHSEFTGFTGKGGKVFQNGEYVDVTNPVLKGKISGNLADLEDGAKIGIYRDHVLLGYVDKSQIKPDGTFSFKLPDGSLTDRHSYIFTTAIVSKSGYVGEAHDVEVRVDTTGAANVPDYGISNNNTLRGSGDLSYTQAVALNNNGEWQVISNSNVWVFNSNGKAEAHYLNYQTGINNGTVDVWGWGPENVLFGSYTMADYNHDGYIDVWSTKTSYSWFTTAAYVGTGDNQWNYVDVKYGDMFNGASIENHLGGIATFDMNGDGYLDVIQGDSGADSGSIFLNKGATSSSLNGNQFIGMGRQFGGNQSALTSNFMTDHHVSAIDLDNNGTIDFAGNGRINDTTGVSGYANNWYQLMTLLNSGKSAPVNGVYGTNWSVNQHFDDSLPSFGNGTDEGIGPDNYKNTISMTWADYNGDGYMDLFLAKNHHNWHGNKESQIFYNKADGTGQLRNAVGLGDNLDGRWSVAIDWDHDGKMDILEVPGFGGSAANTKLWHNGGVGLDGSVKWDNWDIFGSQGGRLSSANGDVDPRTIDGSGINFIYGIGLVDYDWDGALDVTMQRDNAHSSLILSNKNKVGYGTSLHLRITDKDGANVFYNNTVQLFDSAGNLVAVQVINAQGGIGASDNTGLVHFYGLKEDETYSVVVLRNTEGQSNDIGGIAHTHTKDANGYGKDNTIENVNTSWTGLKAVEADHAYILNANKDGDTVTTGAGNNDPATQGYRPGLVGTGYNDVFTAEAGSQSYSGGGGWRNDAGEKYWQASGGEDIVDFGKSTVGVTVDLSNSGYQSTGFNNAKFNDIEGIYGSKFNDTFTGSKGDNFFDGRGGDDTYHLESGGHDLLLYRLLQQDDATGGNGHDTVYGFKVGTYIDADKTKIDANADRIDVADLLQGYRADADGAAHFDNNGKAQIDWGDNIKDFLSTRVENGNTILSIDRDGKGNAFQSADILTLNGVNTDLETLLANHQIIIG